MREQTSGHPTDRPHFESLQPSFGVAIHGAILIQVWRTATLHTGVQEVRRVARDNAGKLKLNVTIIEEAASMPNGAARAELDLLGEELAKHVAMSAVVFESTGFRAAAVRSIMTGIARFTRQALPYQVFSTVPEAAQWLAREYARVPGVRDLNRAIANLRAGYD